VTAKCKSCGQAILECRVCRYSADALAGVPGNYWSHIHLARHITIQNIHICALCMQNITGQARV